MQVVVDDPLFTITLRWNWPLAVVICKKINRKIRVAWVTKIFIQLSRVFVKVFIIGLWKFKTKWRSE